ncbi:MAG: hypothetical protein LQ348_005792 [Seirophora lacunosa]|nr:MAG: hypothetical protein LQ344_000692 [Seirophora lacunosa]KAI4116903.1 MAG: hypothetical protein LQ345_002763 [Seirophora villosa]KAI4177590.1 MAG: hypothetical protein LQ348_005792 [Seirophora lacunosa]
MAGTGVHNIMSKSDFDSAIADPSLMIIDCMATWCAPCKTIAPEIVKLSNTYPAARFYKLDVDEVPAVAQELGVRAMPTFVIFKAGEKIKEIVGAHVKAVEGAVVKELDAGAGAKVE